MNFIGRRGAPEADARKGVSHLTMYADSPDEEITLEDLEVSAADRLKVLRQIETLRSRGTKPDDVYKETYASARALIGDNLADYDTFRRDLVSHHILRLAYCNTEEKRKWFAQYETILFTARLRRETPEGVAYFMQRHGLDFVPVPDEDKRPLLADLKAVWAAVGGTDAVEEDGGKKEGKKGEGEDAETAKFFKVPFLQAMDLVRARRVLVRGGFAYVPRGRIIAIISNRFTTYMKRMLVQANRYLPEALRDERLKPMLEHMSEAYMGPEFGQKRTSDRVAPEDVDGIAASAMPLCMQNLHEGLRKDSHMKHGGRMQYGLFLKGVGLGVEDALAFWGKSFSKKFTPEDFLKKYAYNIRHNYGKEGNRKDYTSYSCVRIIGGTTPGPGDYHGCPFKHWDQLQLKTTLGRMRLTSGAVEDIMASVKTKDYQTACRKQFDARFQGADNGPVGNHPNAYTEQALAFLKAQRAKTPGGAGAGAGAKAGAGAGAAPSPAIAAVAAAVAETPAS